MKPETTAEKPKQPVITPVARLFSTGYTHFARLENGNLGDHKTIEGELYELRMTFGGGLRVYYTLRGDTVVLLLHGGNKASQSRDIEKARQIMAHLED